MVKICKKVLSFVVLSAYLSSTVTLPVLAADYDNQNQTLTVNPGPQPVEYDNVTVNAQYDGRNYYGVVISDDSSSQDASLIVNNNLTVNSTFSNTTYCVYSNSVGNDSETTLIVGNDLTMNNGEHDGSHGSDIYYGNKIYLSDGASAATVVFGDMNVGSEGSPSNAYSSVAMEITNNSSGSTQDSFAYVQIDEDINVHGSHHATGLVLGSEGVSGNANDDHTNDCRNDSLITNEVLSSTADKDILGDGNGQIDIKPGVIQTEIGGDINVYGGCGSSYGKAYGIYSSVSDSYAYTHVGGSINSISSGTTGGTNYTKSNGVYGQSEKGGKAYTKIDYDVNAACKYNTYGVQEVIFDNSSNITDISGNVSATSTYYADGINTFTSGYYLQNHHQKVNGTIDINVGRDVISSALQTKGVYLMSLSGGNTTNVNIGNDVNVSAKGDDGTIYGICLELGDDKYDNVTPIDIASTQNVTVGGDVKAVKGANDTFTGNSYTGLYVSGEISDYNNRSTATSVASEANVRVKGDIESSGTGIYLNNLNAAKADIVVEGTVKGGGDAAVITNGNTDDQYTITVWKIENPNGALIGRQTATGVETQDEAVLENTVNNIQYIIKIDSDNIGLMQSDNTNVWNKTKTLSNGAGKADTVYNVANENDRMYLRLDVPEGKRVAHLYTDKAKSVALLPDPVSGDYYLIMPRGGGIILSMELEDIKDDPIDPVDPVNPDDPVDPVEPVNPVVPAGDDDYYYPTSEGEDDDTTGGNNDPLFVDILGQINRSIVLDPSIKVIDLYMGKHINLTINEIRMLCEQQSHLAKRVHFDYKGKKYVMYIPPIMSDKNYMTKLALFMAEPNSQAGFMRAAQIFGFVVKEES